MTTAHRPTWTPAQGGGGKYDGGLGSLSKQYSARDMVGHTTLKMRQEGQGTTDEVAARDLKAELERREDEAREQTRKDQEKREGIAAISAGTVADEAPAKRARILSIQPNALDADDDDDASSSDESDSEDDDDDTAQLLAELEKIKRERAEEQARKEFERQAEEDQVRRENVMQGNPLLRGDAPADFTVKRRWDDDVVFKNCAKAEERNKKATFVNDTLRSDYHRRFMDKYVQ